MARRMEGAALPRLGGAVFFLLLLLTFANGAYAAFQTGSNGAQASASYQPWKDQYRMDFTITQNDWETMRLYFENVTGPYQVDIPKSQFSNTIWYLTCNGTYQLQFLRSGSVVYWSDTIATGGIMNPSCESYMDGGSRNDLGATKQGNKIRWNDIPGATSYEVWLNGNLIGTVPATGGPYEYELPGPGAATVVARNGNQNIGHSDIPESGGAQCDICQKLRDALACPEWGTYMGELTGAIRNALPTLPEWRSIADQFVNAFSEYLGPVPNPPTVEEIEQRITPQLPTVDTNVPGSNLAPVIPQEYSQPIQFDIRTGPEITIIDESEPIQISEPNRYIESDDPGVMVLPGDARNSSGGIKQPDTIQTPYPTPIPTKQNDYDIPPAEMPIPSVSGGTMPVPEITTGDMPIPGVI